MLGKGGERKRLRGWFERRKGNKERKMGHFFFFPRNDVVFLWDRKKSPQKAKKVRCVQNNNININSGRSFQLTQNAVSVASYRLINTFVALVMNKRGKRKLES